MKPGLQNTIGTNERMRSKSGNMLFLSILGFLTIVGGLMVGVSFLNILFVQNQAQKFADEAALAGAVTLNDSNRIGQMNDMVARSRQLIFTSRLVTELAPSTTPDLQQLAGQFLDEDRQSAIDLEKERARLQLLCRVEAIKAINTRLTQQTSLYRNLAPWLRMNIPHVNSVEFGSVRNTDSNVQALKGVEDLYLYDKSKQFIDKSCMLYWGNIDAKLPEEDNDLTFKLSPLSAPVNNKISPARLALADVFRAQVGNQLPSATKLILSAEAEAGAFATGTNTVQATSVATTNGATPFR